ncbi:hypothetical protein KUM42_13410 [Modestobacter sp. L9-4]|uniref:hypothetical protein n=1 Tax=Modestobacter sp. L9-4 TaxID=2851567 RepID=UPI001C77BDC7|nr:hypothetical protein [Modestobacter sp. L9-4]QXG74852.1 hypothetical protein KUM42_13410 [Modestobacter sp. L9-4]
MPVRPLLVRCSLALLVLLGAVLAAVGGISLGAAGLGAVALAAVVAACLGAGIARESAGPDRRQAAVDAAWRTAVGTVAGLLLLSGFVVLAGAAVTALVVVSVLGVLLIRWALRAARADRQVTAAARRPAVICPIPVGGLTVQALGEEWVRSSAALAQTRDPAVRQELVRRREEALDELERRDPAGFARWIDGGATVDSDPTEFVSSDPAAGSEAP